MSVSARAAAILLGTTLGASAAEKKAAFRAMAKVWHPDLHQGKPTAAAAEVKFKEIMHAYEVLQTRGSHAGDKPHEQGTWRDQVYRGDRRRGYESSEHARAERERESAHDNHFSGHEHREYREYYRRAYQHVNEKESNPVAVALPVALFAVGVVSLFFARRREGDAARKHDYDWISKRSIGGWGVSSSGRRTSFAASSGSSGGGGGGSGRGSSGSSSGSGSSSSGSPGGATSLPRPKPKVGESGGLLPRHARPYQGGSATAAAGVRIGDADVPRDWYAAAPRAAASAAAR